LKNFTSKNIWVVVPVFNEERVVEAFLKELQKLSYSVVVVDDGSTDASSEIIKKYPVHFVPLSINQGQGAALRKGLAYALERGAEYLVTMDADGQMQSIDIPRLLAPVQSGVCDLALGNRFGANDINASGLPFFRKYVLKIGSLVLWMWCGMKLQDSQNGFRVFSRMAAEKIQIHQNRMAHNWEILIQAAKYKFRVQEVPVKISYSHYSLGKGQKLKGVIRILWDLIIK
jgi:glycosyltransferase involved in cell wall biosynthesis